MARLRVLTLNIWHREAPWERRRELIREGILALDPDIIGLQEVLQLRAGELVQNQAAELLRDTPYQFVYGAASSLGPGFEFGNAIASKFPIGEPLVIRLPGEETGETRSLVHAVVATPLGDVPVFATHLNWKLHHGSVRLRQIDAILALMAEKFPIGDAFPPVGETFPPILMGDFNAEPESDEIRFLRGFATREGRSVFFADAWAYGGDGGPGFTFDRKNAFAARSHEPPRRIDYIFVRGPDSKWRGEPLKTTLAFTEPSEDGVWASDHFGLLTELSTHAETRAWPA
ncbi:MAG TPA: endonuclease/exonuclease/phosphatase family protein [Polyangiales bacterium]|nr:endonuclease/exonuclease/phosphatase family protein [Polyangiales bacterium]